jgi:BirA family biotin operon repressor/biotin-[acetyl-CoA-carboxylase] ligase
VSFVTVLAVRDAVCDLTGFDARLKLKWPNDLLCDGEKLGGILIEGEGPFVVVGIGINCAHHPDRTRYPSSNLSVYGAAVSPDAVFEQLSARMLERLSQWNRGAGFAATRIDWLACAFRREEETRVTTGERELTGVFENLNESGALILRLPDGSREAITAGEVFPMISTEEDMSADAPSSSPTSGFPNTAVGQGAA